MLWLFLTSLSFLAARVAPNWNLIAMLIAASCFFGAYIVLILFPTKLGPSFLSAVKKTMKYSIQIVAAGGVGHLIAMAAWLTNVDIAKF